MLSKIFRSEFFILKERLNEPRRFIQVISGPRQVGKTTMVIQVMQEFSDQGIYHSADDHPNPGGIWIDQIWENARLKLRQSGKRVILAIDEIQKIPDWSEVVKKNWDSDSRNELNLQVILLGSSRLLLQVGLNESLAGRFEQIYLNHWSLREMENAFGLSSDQFIWFGGYPGSTELIKDETRWKGYIRNSLIESTLNRDIFQMARIDKPALMRQLFELGCQYSSQVISLTKMLTGLHDAGNTTTLSGYLNLLNEAGLLATLPKYSGNMIRQRGSIPKFQVYNTALISALSPLDFSAAYQNKMLWGRVVESAIGTHLLSASKIGSIQVFYWRENNQEVDFVLKRGESIVAIEVKSGKEGLPSGMSAFKKLYNNARVYLVGQEGIQVDEFLRLDPVSLF